MTRICHYDLSTRKALLLIVLLATVSIHAAAQAFPNIRAGSEVNPLGSNPTGPAGAVFIGGRMWIGDQVFGLVRCDPLNPVNTDPLTSGFVAPVPASSAPASARVDNWCSIRFSPPPIKRRCTWLTIPEGPAA